MGRMDFDAILNHIGQCGKWQWRNFFLLWLTRDRRKPFTTGQLFLEVTFCEHFL